MTYHRQIKPQGKQNCERQIKMNAYQQNERRNAEKKRDAQYVQSQIKSHTDQNSSLAGVFLARIPHSFAKLFIVSRNREFEADWIADRMLEECISPPVVEVAGTASLEAVARPPPLVGLYYRGPMLYFGSEALASPAQ